MTNKDSFDFNVDVDGINSSNITSSEEKNEDVGQIINEYISKGYKYDPKITYEENIDNWAEKFEKEKNYEARLFKARIKKREEEPKYDKVRKDYLDKLKYTKKRNKLIKIILGVAIFIASAIGVYFLIYGDEIKYNSCPLKMSYQSRISCYASVSDMENAEELMNEEFYNYIRSLIDEEEYEEVITAFTKNKNLFADLYGFNSEGEVTRIDDEELNEKYTYALYKIAKKDVTDVEKIEQYKEEIDKLTDKYDAEFDEMIYRIYEQNVHDGRLETVEYFAQQYENGMYAQNSYGRVNLEKALHSYLYNLYKTNGYVTDAEVLELSKGTFSSVSDFYNNYLVKGEYSATMMSEAKEYAR